MLNVRYKRQIPSSATRRDEGRRGGRVRTSDAATAATVAAYPGWAYIWDGRISGLCVYLGLWHISGLGYAAVVLLHPPATVHHMQSKDPCRCHSHSHSHSHRHSQNGQLSCGLGFGRDSRKCVRRCVGGLRGQRRRFSLFAGV